jgi:hypothetical protein
VFVVRFVVCFVVCFVACVLVCITMALAASCPSDCSGHGRCVSLRQLSIEANAVPVGNAFNEQYGGNEVGAPWLPMLLPLAVVCVLLIEAD